MIIKIFLLVGLLRLLDSSDNALLCAGIYAGGIFFIGLLFGGSFTAVVFSAFIGFGLAAMYFFALYYLQRGIMYWIVAIVGMLIVLV